MDELVQSTCADLANFAMMFADNAALPPPPQPLPKAPENEGEGNV